MQQSSARDQHFGFGNNKHLREGVWQVVSTSCQQSRRRSEELSVEPRLGRGTKYLAYNSRRFGTTDR